MQPVKQYGSPTFIRIFVSAITLFFILFGFHQIISTTVQLPKEYARLQQSGIHTYARLDKCARGLGGGRGVGCQLTLTTPQQYTWSYSEDSAQFEGILYGSNVPVLVDSHNPRIAYTVYDIDHHTNVHSPVIIGFGIVLILAGAAFPVSMLLVQIKIRHSLGR